MLYGPPGTGKTTLARHIATVLTGGKWTLVTGSSDWSSQDIIGGYQPVGSGSVAFIPGVLLRRFDRPLIIDELNRCDIDKVIGPLFTVLSGQQTTLPYRLDIEDKDSLQYVILPESKPSAAAHEFAPGPHWRLVATINSIDKASLYQMSYALARRFGWVYVDAPRDTAGFMEAFLRKEDPAWAGLAAGAPCPLAAFWAAINTVRVIGPAPIIDAIKAVQAMEEDAAFFATPTPSMKEALLDAVDMVLLPMLDGIVVQDAEFLAGKAIEVFGLDADQSARIKARMTSVAV
jgi:MoxR-like ATPase